MAKVWLRNLSYLLLVWLALQTPARAASADAFFDATLGDFAAELKAAKQQGKLGILLVFEAENCPFCQRMRAQVLSQPQVQTFFRGRFNIFSVDILGSVTINDFSGQEKTEKALARSLKIRGTPTFLFLDLDGREMARYTGATRDVEEFIALGRYVADGHWQTTTFEQFHSEGRSGGRKRQ